MQFNNPHSSLDSAASTRRARLIAFYLPQFHPIPENDLWWGKGFTEWTNVAKAKPLFRNHYQPRVPADLGFYDLRLPEARAAQAALAQSAGIEGFCYWHYWFGGKRLLERPFDEVVRSGEPDFPFCLAWANQTWTGIWHGSPKRVLIEQTYPGREDYRRHFYALLEAFQDRRYIRYHGKPVFVIFNPTELPDANDLIELWQSLANENGLPGIHFVAHVATVCQAFDYRGKGFDASIASDAFAISMLNSWQRSISFYRAKNPDNSLLKTLIQWPFVLQRALSLKIETYLCRWLSRPEVIEYSEAMLHFLKNATSSSDTYPCAVPNWDHSPRTGTRARIFNNSAPALFRRHLQETLRLVDDRPFDDRIVFVKSWNEWAEGNHLEPDLRFGHQYLDVVREEVLSRASAHAGEKARTRTCAVAVGT